MIDLGKWSPANLALATYGERQTVRYGIVDCRETCYVHRAGGGDCAHDPFLVVVIRGTVALFSRLNLLSIHTVEEVIGGHYIYFGMPAPPYKPESEVWLWFALTKVSLDDAQVTADNVVRQVIALSHNESPAAMPDESWRAPRYREEEEG